jgi:hypothetical protein
MVEININESTKNKLKQYLKQRDDAIEKINIVLEVYLDANSIQSEGKTVDVDSDFKKIIIKD